MRQALPLRGRSRAILSADHFNVSPCKSMGSSAPDPMPMGDQPPPIPPKLTAIGLNDGDDKRRITITKSADGEGKFIRKSGGKGQYGHVTIHIEPNDRGKGVSISTEVDETAIPREFVQATLFGIRSGLNHGFDGRPVVDILIRVSGGSWNACDSSDLAFKMAGIFAVKDAIQKAEPISLD
jgi:Elongation factor G, domain IV